MSNLILFYNPLPDPTCLGHSCMYTFFYRCDSGFGVLGLPVDHIQHFSLLPGRTNIQMKVEIPQDIELVEPLDEACIWRQTRGTATETLGPENKAESTEKQHHWSDHLL
ncbi:unnamed protein product [Lactuca virosa]|uniref:Uncharacterized protein n=1 Tax=Lactuca virosa TaxID=75947 RepID=A0AAU9LQX9_9ASTR|nr:unnamed protein product [Lactuca virosa]